MYIHEFRILVDTQGKFQLNAYSYRFKLFSGLQ